MLTILELEATFGKLDGDILKLEEGLNVFTAPNEWGKSTWCAFLTAMLYGIETKDRSTKTDLADKEHYAPWSGKPMSGRMEAIWNGRRITIYRSTAGRIPMAVFQAFDAETGLVIEELTASNCGEKLIGVEKSVFMRSNFIHQGDMPLGEDDNLRKRLHNLVSSGEDTVDRLADRLQELKNKLRYRKSGMLPQAETELEELKAQSDAIETVTMQIEQLQQELSDIRKETEELSNHLDALKYAEYLETQERIQKALSDLDVCERNWEAASKKCEALEKESSIRTKLSEAWVLQETYLPEYEEKAQKPELPPDEQQIDRARNAIAKKNKKGAMWILPILAIVLLCGAAAFVYLQKMTYAIGCGIGAGCLLLVYIIIAIVKTNEIKRLYAEFDGDPVAWLSKAQFQNALWQNYLEYEVAYEKKKQEITLIRNSWEEKVKALTKGTPLGEFIRKQTENLALWQRKEEALREYQRQGQIADLLQQNCKPVQPPKEFDNRTETEEQTIQLLKEKEYSEQQTLERISMLRGRLAHYAPIERIRSQQMELRQKIWNMEDTYRALETAIETAEETEKILSSRFAPRISKQAGNYLSKMTGGKYTTIQLQQDLSLLTAAEGENRLRSPLWRSSGTEDQLYLAVRLAVAEELSPKTPLILDDAFTRFDDERLTEALRLLEEMDRQVILFSCQGREKSLKKQGKSGKKLLTFF